MPVSYAEHIHSCNIDTEYTHVQGQDEGDQLYVGSYKYNYTFNEHIQDHMHQDATLALQRDLPLRHTPLQTAAAT